MAQGSTARKLDEAPPKRPALRPAFGGGDPPHPPPWPPPVQPRLPTALTAVNTAILLASAVTLRLGLRAHRRGEAVLLVRLLSWTAIGGAVFLLIQGYEWAQL